MDLPTFSWYIYIYIYTHTPFPFWSVNFRETLMKEKIRSKNFGTQKSSSRPFKPIKRTIKDQWQSPWWHRGGTASSNGWLKAVPLLKWWERLGVSTRWGWCFYHTDLKLLMFCSAVETPKKTIGVAVFPTRWEKKRPACAAKIGPPPKTCWNRGWMQIPK